MAFALASMTGAISAYFLGLSKYWAVGGLLIGSVIPYTLFAIMPVNRKLLDAQIDREAESTKDLLVKWGKLHAVRTIVSLGVFTAFMLNVTGIIRFK